MCSLKHHIKNKYSVGLWFGGFKLFVVHWSIVQSLQYSECFLHIPYCDSEISLCQLMSDGLTTVISLVQHIPWPWVGLPLPHPTLFLLTIPTLLTLQESLMKRCLFLSSQCLPVTGNSTHTGMFVHAYIYIYTVHAHPPLFKSTLFPVCAALSIMSTEWHTGKI